MMIYSTRTVDDSGLGFWCTKCSVHGVLGTEAGVRQHVKRPRAVRRGPVLAGCRAGGRRYHGPTGRAGTAHEPLVQAAQRLELHL